MENYTENQQQPQTLIWSVAEVIVLLMLPLPFLKLNAIYLFSALLIMFLSKYLRKEDWDFYGFRKVEQKLIIWAIALGVGYGFVDNFLIEPVLTRIVGAEPDLSAYAAVKGNVANLIAMLGLGWIVGGLFEEFFFRGYLYHRIFQIFPHPALQKWIAVLATSIVFAFAHNYQGIGGITSTFMFALVMGLLYFKMGRNVWYLVLFHGFYDTVGIFSLFLGA